MASKAIRTQGTIIAASAATPPVTFTTIGEVISFDGPGGKAQIIDTTNLASVAKEKLPGLPDEGQFTLTVNYVSTDPGQAALAAARLSQSIMHFKVTLVDGGLATFDAYVMEYKISGKADSKVEASIGMEITGLVDWTDGTTGLSARAAAGLTDEALAEAA
jgi:predicted secreted protein